jgi:hypothetical protein
MDPLPKIGTVAIGVRQTIRLQRADSAGVGTRQDEAAERGSRLPHGDRPVSGDGRKGAQGRGVSCVRIQSAGYTQEWKWLRNVRSDRIPRPGDGSGNV